MSVPLGDGALDHLRQVADWPQPEDPRYEMLDRLGEGGMSVVYRARDHALQRDVAIKVLHDPEIIGDQRSRIEREARILASLEHPAVVPIHDLGRCADGRVYYVMKLIDGRRFDRELESLPSLRARIRLFQRACEAVAFAHSRGVIHRDLKPSNIMVGAFGEILVLDWGVAKLLHGPAGGGGGESTQSALAGQTMAGTVLGTPGFMSPEQAAGESERVDARSDVYSLGAILEGILERGERAPRLNAVARKALAEIPADRYEDVESFSAELGRFLDDETPLAYRERWHERVGRFVARNRTLLLLFGVYLLTRLLIGWLSA